MSAFPEMHYACDRCSTEMSVAIQNVPPPMRAAGPAGWLCLSIGTDPAKPPSHLCEECAIRFAEFMKVTS